MNDRFLLEASKLKKALKKQKPLVDTTENVVACEACNTEILYAYVKCWFCHVMQLKRQTEHGAFYCINCYQSHECELTRLEFVAKFNTHELKHLNTRIAAYLDKCELLMPQAGLDCLYDKYADDNVYKSAFDGISNVIRLEAGEVVKADEVKWSEDIDTKLTIYEKMPYDFQEESEECYLKVVKRIVKPKKPQLGEKFQDSLTSLPQKRASSCIVEQQPAEREEPTKAAKLEALAEVARILEKAQIARRSVSPPIRSQNAKSHFSDVVYLIPKKQASN